MHTSLFATASRRERGWFGHGQGEGRKRLVKGRNVQFSGPRRGEDQKGWKARICGEFPSPERMRCPGGWYHKVQDSAWVIQFNSTNG